jgi:hypothetical protein
MHRWHFQRLFRWLVPVFVFAVALCVMVARQKTAGAGLSFLNDRTYADFAVARSMVEEHAYALCPDQAAPAVHDVLWRLAVAATTLATGDEGASAYILGAVFSLVTILICLRLSHLLFPFPPFIMYSAVLLILSPSLLMTSVDEPSLAMSTALVIAACLFHVEGLSERRTPLPMRSALLVGLLMWVHLEFFILWIVFFIHAIVMNVFNRDRSVTTAFVVTRGLTGAFLLALCMFPLLAWNFSVLQVPWPQVVGAPFVMDTWLSAGPVEAIRSYFSLARSAFPSAFSLLYATPFLSGTFELVVVWFGVLFITGLAIWRPEERPYTLLLFLLLLMPACYALIYPYLGWGAAAPVFSALSPLCIVAASFGIFRIPFLIENLYRKWKAGLPAASGFSAWWIVMGSILLLVCIIRSGSLLNRRNAALVEQVNSRAVVSDAIKSGAIPGKWVVTDQPGWLAYAHRVRVVDLTGEFTPQVLACLDDKGGIDAAELGAYLAGESVDSMVLWTPESETVSSLVPCEPITRNVAGHEPEWPKICAISSSGAF